MKTIRRSLFLLLFAGGIGACSWSSFDELADETWVDSVGGAEGVEPNSFIGIAAPGTTDENAVFVALGRSTDSVNSYNYDSDGARASIGADIHTDTTQFGILPVDAPIAGDPYSNNVGVASTTNEAGMGDTKVLTFPSDDVSVIVSQLDFNRTGNPTPPLDGSIPPTGLAFARTDVEHTPPFEMSLETDVVVARGAQIALIVSYEEAQANERAEFHACYGQTDADTVLSVAAGQFDANDDDDELVAVLNDADGALPQVVVFNGSSIAAAQPNETDVLINCFSVPGFPALAIFDGPTGAPRFGKSLTVADFDGDGDPDIAIGDPDNATVTVFLWDDNPGDGVTQVVVEPPLDAGLFGSSLAAGDLDGNGDAELVVGAPDSNVDGVDNAGTAYVFDFSGGSFTLALTLHDAQPEAQQAFGTSVGVVPWGGSRNVVVVGAEAELFTYFRTALYDDVRQ